MEDKATFKQTAVIWKFCGKFGNQNTDWAKIAKQGELSKEYASEIIGNIIKWKESGGEQCYINTLEMDIGVHISGFKIVKAPEGEKISAPVESAPVSKPVNEAGQLEQLLGAMEQLLNKDAVKALRDAFESALEKAGQGYKNYLRKAEADIQRYRKEIEELRENGSMPSITPINGDYIKHAKFDMVACLTRAKQNVLMTGPAGTGKSRMAREVASALDLPAFTLSLGGGMRYSQVYGSTQLLNGESKWTPAPFLQWVQTPCVIVLEEIFGADPDVLLGMNQLLEPSTREISTPIGSISVHPECRFIACANTTGRSVSRQYTGAQRADDSLLSRFAAKVFIDYDQYVEDTILKQVNDEHPRKYFKHMLTELRQKIKESNIAFDAGTRELISAIGNYAAGLPYKLAFEVAFLGGLSQAEKAKLDVQDQPTPVKAEIPF